MSNTMWLFFSLQSFSLKRNFISDDKCYVKTTLKWNYPKRDICACEYFINTKIKDQTIKTKFTAQKMKFSIKDFSSKCDQIRSLEKSLMENFIFCAVIEFHVISPAMKTNRNRIFFIAEQNFISRKFHFGSHVNF